MIMVKIMLIHDLSDLLGAHVVAQLCEGIAKISPRNLVGVVSVESLEEGLDALRCSILIDREGSCDELMIVDDSVTIDIYFFDDMLQLFFGQLSVAFGNCLS